MSAKGLFSKKRMRAAWSMRAFFPAGFGQANGELPSILGVTAALDEAVELELGQDLGKRPRLEVKVHAEFLLRHLAAGLLWASRQMMGALPTRLRHENACNGRKSPQPLRMRLASLSSELNRFGCIRRL